MDRNAINLYYQKYGALYVLKKAMRRIGAFLFSSFRLNFYCVLSVPTTQIQPKCPLTIRKGNFDDIELIVNFADNDNKQKVYEQTRYFMDKGGEIFLAFSEGELAHIARLCYYPGIIDSNPLEIHPPVRINKDEVYIGFCQTSSKYKGKNIYPAVLQYIIKYAFEHNTKKCFISTSSSSAASMRGIEKAGFHFVGQKHKFRILGKLFNNCWSSSTVHPNELPSD